MLRALILGISVALIYFLLLTQSGVPASVVNLLDSRSITELSIHGGSVVHLHVEAGTASDAETSSVARALRARGATVASASDASVVLELPEVHVVDARVWAEQITARGEIALQMVIEDSEFSKQAYGLAKESGRLEIDMRLGTL
ncbi:MAG: hypothetical protein GY811_28655 [Myxococcales bacterium]|nr:hypothetical protein [Myxococcales bacterium]